jgi:sec-independent protein translocase protein TatB
MLDIGWTELLVIAIVLIVVVGPKDLPPMIKAFGRTMANLRKITGEFRTQFDQALKEADMDDVRKTIGDVQNLNPSNALRDAINPLRQMGNEIRSDLQKSVSVASAAPEAVAPATEVTLPEPQMKLPDSPPSVPAPAVAATAVTSDAPVAAATDVVKPAPKPRAKKAAKADVSVAVADAEAKAAPSKKKPAQKKGEKVKS